MFEIVSNNHRVGGHSVETPAHYVRTFGLEHAAELGHQLRRDIIVSIEKEKVIAGCSARARVPCRANTSMALSNESRGDAGCALEQLRAQGRSSIAGTVVHHYDFSIISALSENGPYAAAYVGGYVVRRDDDAQSHCVPFT
ncbi:hypothetical protein IDVR_01980 [Intrasporangium sp. DVR]